jgi:dienelactone hydrolase
MIVRAALAWLAVVLVVSGCATGAEPPFDLTTAMVSDETTGQLFVSAPDAEGSWPVVVMLHGIGGDPHEMDRLATTVAEQGNVVFNMAWDPAGDLMDVVCGYRYAESIAARYGGNPEHVAAVGYSAGAVVALLGATSTEPEVPVSDMQLCSLVDGRVSPPAQSGVVLPAVLVMIAPCMFEYEGQSFRTEPQDGNTDLQITVVSGENDTVCEPWQQRDGVELLRDAGREARLVSVPAADHLALVYNDIVDGQQDIVPDSPAGQRTTQTIVDTIASAHW